MMPAVPGIGLRIGLLLGFLLGPGVAACRDADSADQERVAALSKAVDRFDGDLVETEQQVASLSEAWSRLAEGYTRVAVTYRAARQTYEAARAAAGVSRTTFESASESWKAAQLRWELYREIVLIAVQMDRSGASSGRGATCNPMSTAAFRRLLIAQGFDLAGKDIDHIVPRALGGADDPANYQVLDSSLNRSLGKTWNAEKCLMAGRRQCREAVAVSSRCGAYQGAGFW